MRHKLVEDVMQTCKGASAQEIKDRLDSHMKALGYPFHSDKTLHGKRIKLSYLGCRWARREDEDDFVF
jgi:hypothetical protein